MLHQNQPLSKPLISLCMIVKDEAQRLPRCLASAKPYVDETVVVDTGSQDETISIAKEYGAKVSSFQWCDDFAAARNYSLSLATGQWILLLDADEELVVEDQNFRQYLTDDAHWSEMICMKVIRSWVVLISGYFATNLDFTMLVLITSSCRWLLPTSCSSNT
jgi:glycosyltransferase involved in cell wall biosynthesis